MQKGVSFSEYTLSHNFDFQKHVNAPHLQKIKCYPQGLGSVGCLHTQGQCETRFDMCQTVLYLGFELDHPAHTKPRANGFPMSSFWHRLSQRVNRDETFQLSVFKVMRQHYLFCSEKVKNTFFLWKIDLFHPLPLYLQSFISPHLGVKGVPTFFLPFLPSFLFWVSSLRMKMHVHPGPCRCSIFKAAAGSLCAVPEDFTSFPTLCPFTKYHLFAWTWYTLCPRRGQGREVIPPQG